jgi:hypothetical protein
MLLDFRPRFVGGHGVEARYRDVCSIARSLRGLLDVCSIPAEGTRRAPDRPAQPADLVPPVEPPPGGGETARSCGVRGYGVMLHGAPSNRAGAPPAPPVCTAWTIGCAAEWRRGVGRQARQSGGCIALIYMCFLNFVILETVQVSCTPPLLSLMPSRTVGRLRCSTDRRSICLYRHQPPSPKARSGRAAGSSVTALKGAEGIPSIMSFVRSICASRFRGGDE